MARLQAVFLSLLFFSSLHRSAFAYIIVVDSVNQKGFIESIQKSEPENAESFLNKIVSGDDDGVYYLFSEFLNSLIAPV